MNRAGRGRRRWTAAAAAALLVAAGCGGEHRATGNVALREVQVANGPIAATPGRRPLDVHLDARDPIRVPFHHPPRAGLLFDLDTGRVLWRRNPETVLPIASLTKMMTALVVASRAPADTKVRVTKEALAYRGSGVGVLPKGKRVRLETLLNGLLLPSGNDAAIALAQRVGGTVTGFVAQMNGYAAELGLRCTRYSSPDGFEDAGNHSCAADLAALARAVLDQPRLARIVRRRQAIMPFPIKGGRIWLYNNNPLLRRGYPGVIGIKTGYTDAAGHCLVAAARRHERTLGVVLLHSPDTGDQATKLLDRGFRAVR
jgi:serine-type D-Ala-D-Ala carboxypeptidase (penicillin-binding protein 5/6)